MKNPSRLVLAALLVLSAAGCKAKLNGNITVNGAAFKPTSCRSGQVNNFNGVDLVDESGATLRLVATPTMQTMVVYMPAGGQPMELGACGNLSIQRTNTQINNVYNVEGQAQIACPSPQGMVAGNITFANCH